MLWQLGLIMPDGLQLLSFLPGCQWLQRYRHRSPDNMQVHVNFLQIPCESAACYVLPGARSSDLQAVLALLHLQESGTSDDLWHKPMPADKKILLLPSLE